MFNRQKIRDALERELKEEKYGELLDEFLTETDFTGFASWEDMFAFLHDKSVPGERKDPVLSAIFTARVEIPNPAWTTVVTLAFWPALDSIFLQKLKWDGDYEELWHKLYVAFLDAVDRFDPAGRPTGISTKIYFDTMQILRDTYQDEWDYMDSERQMEDDDDSRALKNCEEESFDAADTRLEFEFAMKTLSCLRDDKKISDKDFSIIYETLALGRTLAEYAAEHGLSVEAAKKRRQRALDTVRKRVGRFF